MAVLKKALTDGRRDPSISCLLQPCFPPRASSALSSYPSSSLLTEITQKDLHSSMSSPRMGSRFWGEVGVDGRFTPARTMLVPEITTIVRRGLQENMNSALNGGTPSLRSRIGADKGGLSGFRRFAYLHPFTMKTLDVHHLQLSCRCLVLCFQAQTYKK
ncbi:hypothetical protein GALMADRAFT_1293107 [Galerina marginata CBS 339.88]|uniref:Uncharacterized protein n=1 Tax=Galerina marginata (strain CBS 339.88) TaxID=685588 RepID=A0A067T454_GALM3|nr:hypothetical protein GALMADRAFT_1293107 [Galerina marginata CBS 339.88]